MTPALIEAARAALAYMDSIGPTDMYQEEAEIAEALRAAIEAAEKADEIERQAVALQEARLEVLHGIRAAIPANMASDRPYRPVNLGWSQCAETMRQIIDAAIDAAMKEKWDE